MSEINPNMHPSGGYVFTDRDGHRHRADGWKALRERVAEYRKINRMDPGDPWAEIQVFHCVNNPSYCRQVGTVQGTTIKPASLNDRVVRWFVKLIQKKRDKQLPRVDDSIAAKRAKICLHCPRHSGLSEACENCLTTIKTGQKAVLNGANSLHQNLKYCAALGEDCSISVHIEQPVATVDLPSACWRR